MWYKIFFAFAISFAVQYFMIWLCHKYGIFIDRVKKLPQKFHRVSTPRCGGIGILIGSCILLSFDRMGLFLILASIPAFIVGLMDDFRRNVLHYTVRLPLISISSILFVLLFPEVLTRIHTPIVHIPIIDSLPGGVISAIAILFMIIAISGVTNAINIIDGFNGLSSGISLIAFMFLGFMAYIVGDMELLKIISLVISATIGFFLWNFPKGKMFLGDGGAYFLGFSLATTSLLLVCRNPAVSIWYPFIILGYPVWEVLFSIYRKTLVRKQSPMKPDSVHLHMLIYSRIANKSHTKTSLYLWLPSILMGSLALQWYNLALVLVGLFVLYIISYAYFYSNIVRFKFGKQKNK